MPSDAPVATLDAALARTAALMDERPDLAERQAREILLVVPADPRALTLLGAALRRLGDSRAALEILAPLAIQQPRAPQVHIELAAACSAAGETGAAIAAYRHALELKPDRADLWRALGDLLAGHGDQSAADRAHAEAIARSTTDPMLIEAALALRDDRLAVAESLLRERLRAQPTDAAALRMLGEAGVRLGRYGEAEAMFERCLELSPSFTGARHGLAVALFRQQKGAEALAQIRRLLEHDPEDGGYRTLLAGALSLVGDYTEAVDVYAALLSRQPGQPRLWLSQGHSLRTAGRRDEAIAAYRRSLDLAPGLGESWWSLANLKTRRFEEAEVAAMETALARADLSNDDRLHLHYALGKAFEDEGAWAMSFGHYAEGARLRRAELPYDADETMHLVDRSIALLQSEAFDRPASGAPDRAPIFILGLPRSGSTLLEQILASHSQVEGTIELPDIARLARELALTGGKGADYRNLLAILDPAVLRAMGETYLERTLVHRKRRRPLFIDKMPNNWLHAPLIHLILPNAIVIDARRAPMAAGFSCFKQNFARGQGFSYDLADVGRYYRDYLRLMRAFDARLPGRAHLAIYEDVVADTEREVRRLLDHCGLPFEEACLRFHETARAVRTASSEQVRRPIFREGLDQWRNYEPWLGPLREALGEAETDWR